MYVLFRAAILAIFIGFFVALFAKVKVTKKVKMVLIIAFTICYLALFNFPVENLLLGFQSPKAAFSYTNIDRIINVVEQNDAAAVLYKDRDGSPTFSIIKRDSKGWKINNPNFDPFERLIRTDDYFLIYRIVANDQLFVSISIFEQPGEITQVQTIEGDDFYVYQNGDDSSGHYNIYYGFVNGNKEFYVFIGGKKVQIG